MRPGEQRRLHRQPGRCPEADQAGVGEPDDPGHLGERQHRHAGCGGPAVASRYPPRPQQAPPAGVLWSRAGAHGRATRLPARAAGRAVTTHSPGLMPRTSAVTATGPLPGITAAVTSWVNVSPGRGLPVTPAHRPENHTAARNGPPLSPGSSQNTGVSTSCSMPSAHPDTPPATHG